jgi:prepilin-type N-terminal cleavage/methylation domain-containing protein
MKVLRMDRCRNSKFEKSSGFSLIEVLVAIVVLGIGLVGLLSVLSFAMASTHGSQEDLIAKQLASEAMESVFTARNSGQLVWLQIQNQGAGTTPDGVFLPGFQPINQAPVAGNNAGLINTPEYIAGAPRVLNTPGQDGIMGTADDVTVPLTGYQRSISIVSVPGTGDQLRTVTVNVQYRVVPMNLLRNYTIQGYISQFR